MPSPQSQSQYRCPDCRSTPLRPRDLVVFIDGTSNQPGDQQTNIVKLHDQVKTENLADSEPEQLKKYLPGIGVYDTHQLRWPSRATRAICSELEKALAWNAEKNVLEAYRWLVDHYREGDQIYIFGFSRGGFQVRALASLIHEVGLVKKQNQVDFDPELESAAYNYYLAIDPYKPETRGDATRFKMGSCWQNVRIHFIGVWDTVSSLGIVKRDVHVTESASVTNACHFRQALALDERRVKFMPEYFLEMNAHSQRGSPRSPIGDVKEVWFPGCHSDIGGMDRPDDQMLEILNEREPGVPHAAHAGNVSLLWMRQEAAASGLVFKPGEFVWDPEDVDYGREDSMTFGWGIMEIFPVRYQTSFSGTGKHKWGFHLFRPRSIIPRQQIHPSVWSGSVYTPPATLIRGIHIPTVPRGAIGGLWAPDNKSTTQLLTSLLETGQKALDNLVNVLFLFDTLLCKGQPVPKLQWAIDSHGQSDLTKFALAVICDATPDSTVSDERLQDARASLSTILSTPNHPELYKTLLSLRFSARHAKLRQRFIGHDDVIIALIGAMKRTAESPAQPSFSLIMDSLYYLVCGSEHDHGHPSATCVSLTDDTRDRIIRQLSAMIEIKASLQTATVLKVMATLVRGQPGLGKEIKPRIRELATKKGSSIGWVAVEVLDTMKEEVSRDVHFGTILDYLDNTLPRLDAEVDDASPPETMDDLPPVLLVTGSVELRVRELVETVKSHNTHTRAIATFVLLKLCQNSIVRESCFRQDILGVFVQQLHKKSSSLLAAYALKACFGQLSIPRDVLVGTAERIISMLEKGWFDDAVGRVEGHEIFRGLMSFDGLRLEVLARGVFSCLVKKLEVGDRHERRMSLLCLDIFGRDLSPRLNKIVTDSVVQLKDTDEKIQRKGVKTLAILAQTSVGETVIMPRLVDIVQMLSSIPRHQSLGPAAALYDLSKNEHLREHIRDSSAFEDFKRRRSSGHHASVHKA